jgi:homoserine/homoserine lactone efflux protein
VRSGFKAGVLATAGVAVANLTLIGTTFATLLGLLSLSSTAFAMMKWIGIGLLVWFACRIFVASAEAIPGRGPPGERPLSVVIGGYLVGLSSPYNLLFYLALLPQLMPAEALRPAAIATATLALLVGCAMALVAVSLLAVASGTVFRMPTQWLERGAAAAMIALAGLAAFSAGHRSPVEGDPIGTGGVYFLGPRDALPANGIGPPRYACATTSSRQC